jgi:uncharacterized protein
MSTADSIILWLIFFGTSILGVITGSNSLITVPVMLLFGIDPRVAIATNMFALIFLSIGGTLPFLKKGLIDRQRLRPLILLTLLGSVIGAFLVVLIPAQSLSPLISFFMIAVTLFALLHKETGTEPTAVSLSSKARTTGYLLTFLLAIYGGFFSGGYVTMLTAAYVAVYRMNFIQAIAITKVINIFSSLIATLIFAWLQLIDYPLAIRLSLAMLLGAITGSRLVLHMNQRLVRRVFIAAVLALALKILFYDFWWKNLDS